MYSLQHLPTAASTVTGMDSALSSRTAGQLATENSDDHSSGNPVGTEQGETILRDLIPHVRVMIRLKKNNSFCFKQTLCH